MKKLLVALFVGLLATTAFAGDDENADASATAVTESASPESAPSTVPETAPAAETEAK
ncbi:MAG TPA: hypothetical protein VIM43_04695 [Rugosibacter sp.]